MKEGLAYRGFNIVFSLWASYRWLSDIGVESKANAVDTRRTASLKSADGGIIREAGQCEAVRIVSSDDFRLPIDADF